MAAPARGQLDARPRGRRPLRPSSSTPSSTPAARRTWRTYRYTILNRARPTRSAPATRGGCPSRSTCRALRLGADPFVGEHDFASFCRKGPEGSSTVRRVLESRWLDEGDGVLRYEIRGNAFCWQMVRSIVGTLVEVGIGKPGPATSWPSCGPATAAPPASSRRPSGLCLWEVGYELDTVTP